MGLSSLESLPLLVSCLVTHLLYSTQPGGGCLMGTMGMLKFCELLDFLVWALGVSMSIRSSSQSDLKHQHLSYFFVQSPTKLPYKVWDNYLYLIII